MVGCCLNFVENLAFFTRNGTPLGVAFRALNLSGPLYPLVGLRTLGEAVEANFGQSPFLFDVESYVKVLPLPSLFQPLSTFAVFILSQEVKGRFVGKIKASEIPAPAGGLVTMNDLVRSYLIHHGYTETAKMFSHASGKKQETDQMQLDEDISIQLLSIKNRRGRLLYSFCFLCFIPGPTLPSSPCISHLRADLGW